MVGRTRNRTRIYTGCRWSACSHLWPGSRWTCGGGRHDGEELLLWGNSVCLLACLSVCLIGLICLFVCLSYRSYLIACLFVLSILLACSPVLSVLLACSPVLFVLLACPSLLSVLLLRLSYLSYLIVCLSYLSESLLCLSCLSYLLLYLSYPSYFLVREEKEKGKTSTWRDSHSRLSVLSVSISRLWRKNKKRKKRHVTRQSHTYLQQGQVMPHSARCFATPWIDTSMSLSAFQRAKASHEIPSWVDSHWRQRGVTYIRNST